MFIAKIHAIYMTYFSTKKRGMELYFTRSRSVKSKVGCDKLRWMVGEMGRCWPMETKSQFCKISKSRDLMYMKV